MRRIRFVVVTSLDSYIAGPNGEADWIIFNPEIDFAALYNEFDTLLIGRRTFESMIRGGSGMMADMNMKMFVFSRTLRPGDFPQATIVAERMEETLTELRAKSGKDIWLFGGGSLFRSLLDAGFVDTVETAVIPVLLGGGIPLLPPPARQTKLQLIGHKVYRTGIVSLQYEMK